MKKLLLAVAVTALFVATPALADDNAAPKGGLLPYGLGLTITNDVAYAIDAETITSESQAVVDWRNVYVGVMPTVVVNASNVVSLSDVEYEAGYNADIFGTKITPYVTVNTDGDGEYQDTNLGFRTSVKF